MIDTAKFWDKMADKYAKKPVPNEEVYQIKKDLTREYFTPDSKVFEFGCGTGTTAISHAPFVKHVTVSGHGLQQSLAVGRAVSELIIYGEHRTLDLSRFAAPRLISGDLIRELYVV